MTTYYGTAAGTGIYVRVGEGGAIQTSPDPNYFPWTDRVSGTANDLFDVVWTQQSFVAVGASGTILRSTDGVTWAAITSPTGSSLMAVAAGFPIVMAVGLGGVCVKSDDDGVTFAAFVTGVTTDLYDILIDDGYYIIVGDNNTILYGTLTTTELVVYVNDSFTMADTLPIPEMTLDSTASDSMGFDEGLTGLRVSGGGDVHLVAVNEAINFNASAAPTKVFDETLNETIEMPNAASPYLNAETGGEFFFEQVAENMGVTPTADSFATVDEVISETIEMPNAASPYLNAETGGEVFFEQISENLNLPQTLDVIGAFYETNAEAIGFANVGDARQFNGDLGEVLFGDASENMVLVALTPLALHKSNQTITNTIAFSTHLFDSFEKIVEAFTLSETLTGAYARIAEDAFTLSSAAAQSLRSLVTLDDTLTLAEDALANQNLTADSADSFTLDDTSDLSLFLAAFADDSLSLSAAVSPEAMLQALAADSFTFGAVLVSSGQIVDAWVINPENRAVSTYENFGFNSMCASDFGVFATDGSAIYELTGPDDAGTAIEGWIRSAITDFGTAYIKNLERMYLGLRSDGRMLVKTVTNDQTENWYEVKWIDDGVHDARVKFGRGNKARFWQFELRNIRGADFDLESLVLVPIRTSRRVN